MRGCRPLSDEEIARCLDALAGTLFPLRNRAFLQVGLRTGFRVSELLSIRVRDVYRGGVVLEQVTVGKKCMKGKKDPRTIELHRLAREAIAAWVSELAAKGVTDPDTFLFLSRQGENAPMNRRTAWKMLKKAYAVCGLTGKLATHTMRKTFAKKIYSKTGKDIMAVKEALGQRRITSTQNYLDFEKEELKKAILDD